MQGHPFMTVVWDEERLVPDVLLPEQFLDRVEPTTPELSLLRAVLKQAMKDLYQQRRPRSVVARHIYRDAYNWIASTTRSYPFSFVNVCEALGLTPGATRKKILEGAPRPAFVHVGEAA